MNTTAVVLTCHTLLNYARRDMFKVDRDSANYYYTYTITFSGLAPNPETRTNPNDYSLTVSRNGDQDSWCPFQSDRVSRSILRTHHPESRYS